MQKFALFAFNGDAKCFLHVLLNAMDMRQKGFDTTIILEGAATKAAADMLTPDAPFNKLLLEVKDAGLFDCVCFACAKQTGAYDTLKNAGFSFGDDMNGHPSMGRYIEEGYTIVTF